jgi:hypothetical protein
MTGTLLAAPVYRAVDQNGAPMAGALLQFYLTGTTTPTNIYTSSALSTPLSNPVVADSGGLFPAIYLDPTVVYRMQLLTSASVLVKDIDPVTESVVEATQTQVNAGTSTGIYVSPAKLAAWTGVPGALGYTPANKAGDTLTNSLLAFTSLSTNSSGYLGLPVNEQDAAYSTALTDAGKMVRCNSASAVVYTLPPVSSVAYPPGTAITFRNVGAGVVTLTPGSGVTVAKAGSAPQATIALAQYALCTAIMETTNAWVVSGVGMT